MTEQKPPLPSLQQTRILVGEFFKTYFSNRILEAETIGKDYARLWQSLAELNQRGGKRLRPHLLQLAFLGFGGKKSEQILPIAAALELLHMSLLIHDDIIDRDLIRYNGLNVAGQYEKHYRKFTHPEDAKHFALSAALLAGDIGLSEIYHLINSSAISPSKKLDAIQLFNNATRSVMAGELLDTEASFIDTKQDKSLGVAALKTASYSCILPLKLGAMLADASKKDIEIIEKTGHKLGVAYQLADDLLGLFGDSEKIGKPRFSDFEEGKKTHLVHVVLQHANTSQKEEVTKLISKKSQSGSELAKLQKIIETSGAKRAYEQEIEAEAEKVKKLFESTSLTRDAKRAFSELTDRMVFRSY